MIKLKPKAKHIFCWICSKKLYAGGRFYTIITGEDKREHPVHKTCADRYKRDHDAELHEKWGLIKR